jgi:hypothetical protein
MTLPYTAKTLDVRGVELGLVLLRKVLSDVLVVLAVVVLRFVALCFLAFVRQGAFLLVPFNF